MDMNFDRGTIKLVDTEAGPVLAEPAGFLIVARVDTQDQARAAKAAIRALGPDYQQVNYDIAVTVA